MEVGDKTRIESTRVIGGADLHAVDGRNWYNVNKHAKSHARLQAGEG